MRKIDYKEFASAYEEASGNSDYMKHVRGMNVGESIAIDTTDKEDAVRKRHNIIIDAGNMRKRGLDRRYQTVIRQVAGHGEPVKYEVWIRRTE
tara:strand:- start:3986 stop:4264 length:279 start_codon:yes stop_codon:yes gene_type:complete